MPAGRISTTSRARWVAARYVQRLEDPREGLVADGAVDRDALRTVVDLRRRYQPDATYLGTALEPDRGLLHTPVS